MADEIIGSVGIQIEADASDLQGQFDAAVSQAESAGERIAQAFESLVGIGEALAITEGLKEFGEEALTVYGTVQSVTIGLTQLTKSASDANEIIGQIKELANTEPFAFPEIAPTVQKMVALGVSAEQIPAVMHAAADAAAATGNSFDQVANSIDRMSLSGTVSARSLVQLGVSTEDLGQAMGVTADEVKTAFAALDQSARIDILTAALQKFGGAAEAQAQGIAGQWQIFQNKFEEVMSGVGEALTPAISDILKFGDDTLHVAQEVIDAFNGLSEPVKEAAGIFAVAVAALAPLTVAVGTLGIGIIGVKAAIEPLNEVLVALGLRSGEVAVAQEAEAVAATHVAEAEGEAAIATAAAGESASTAVFGFAAMDTAVAGAGAALAGLLVYDLAGWADKNVPAIHAVADEVYGLGQKVYDLSVGIPGAAEALTLWVTGALKPGAAAADQLSQSTFLLSQKLGDLGIVIPRGTQTMEQWNAALRTAADNYQKTADAATTLGGGLDTLVAKQEKLNATEQQAAADLLIAKQAYADGAIGLDVLNAAQDAYTKAVTAAQAKSSDFKETLAGMTDAYNKQQGVISTLENTQAQLLAVESRTADQENILTEVSNKLAAAKKAEAETHSLVKIAIQGEGTAYEGLVTSADAFLKKETDVGQAVVYAKSVLDDLTARNDTSAAGQRALTDAVNQYASAMQKAGGALTDEITVTVNGVQVMTTLGDAINQVKQSQGDWTSTVVNGVTVIKDHTAAVSANSQALQTLHGTIVTGQPIIRGYIDDTTKAIGYNQQFTGSVNDMGAALGNTLTPNLNSATSSLSNLTLEAEQADQAMKQLGADAKSTGDEIDQAISAMDNWNSHMGSADGMGLATWALSAGLSGETTFAGSGTNFGAGQMDPGQAASALNQSEGIATATANLAKQNAALALTYPPLTTATANHTAATTASTTATTAATASTTALNTSINNLTTAAGNSSSTMSSTTDAVTGMTTVIGAAAPVVNFAALSGTQLGTAIDALNSQLLSAGVVVDTTGLSAVDMANKLQDTVNNMNASAAAVQYLSKSASTAAVGITNAASQIYDALDGIQAITGNANGSGPSVGPTTSALTSLATPTQATGANAIPVVLGTYFGPNGLNTITGTPGESLSQALAAMFPGAGSGSFSMQSAIAQTPTAPFGNVSSSTTPGGTPVNIVMNYPQFNSQQQSSKIGNDIVTMLRTVPSLKL